VHRYRFREPGGVRVNSFDDNSTDYRTVLPDEVGEAKADSRPMAIPAQVPKYFSNQGESRVKHIVIIVLTFLISGIYTCCYAERCNCDDWMGKGGYCVDYIKARIQTFPSPQYKEEMIGLKNTEIGNITEGDVAVFTVKNYWHVAYVEKVHHNQHGEATAIDVSEMNFGDELSFGEFKSTWKSRNADEWNRAICCGITDDYNEVSFRKNINLNTVKQVWSPDNVVSERVSVQRVKALVGRVREVINRFIEFTSGEL
jgi:hypothetical protein